MREETKMNKYLSEDGYKLIYADSVMYSLYRVVDNVVVEIVHNFFDENEKGNSIFIAIEDLKQIVASL